MKNKKRKKLVAWLILIVLLVILLVASFLFGNDILEVINLGSNKDEEVVENKSNDNKSNENKSKETLSDSDIKNIYNIIGINDDSDACGVQSILTQVDGRIGNLSNKDKYELLYFYAYNNKLTTSISSSDYEECSSYGGECVSITKENYDKIARLYDITDKPEQLFDSSNIYKDKYIFDLPECNIEKYTHDTKYEKVNDEVIVTDNVTIGDEKQTITYTFKINQNKEYYLFSIK